MKYLVWIIFLITVQNVFPSGNIYEDALNHFIEHTINDQERGRLNIGKDSIYKHMLIFESNDVIEENIPNVVSGYEIRKIRYIKDYLDTTLIDVVKIFTLDMMDYCNTCDAPFAIVFCEYTAVKRDSAFVWRNRDTHAVSYRYDCKKRNLYFKYCSCSTLDSYYVKQVVKKKGWIDD